MKQDDIDNIVGLSLKDILNLPEMSNCKVLTGAKYLSNVVQWVHSSDLPDIGYWLRGGEFLLHTGSLNYNLDLIHILRQLHAADAAGLGIVMTETKLNKDVKELANLLKLPIINIPDELKFVDITKVITNKLNNKQVEISIMIEDFWTEVQKKDIITSDVKHTIEFIAYFLKTPIAIYDKELIFVHLGCEQKEGLDVINLPKNLHELEQKNVLLYPIMIKDNIRSTLVFPVEKVTDNKLKKIKRLAPNAIYLINLALKRSQQVADIRQELKLEFFKKIINTTEYDLNHNLKSFNSQAKNLGFDLFKKIRICSINTPEKIPLESVIKYLTELFVYELGVALLYTVHNHTLKISIPASFKKNEVERLFSLFKSFYNNDYKEKIPPFLFGLGEVTYGIKGIRISSQQSEIALQCTKSKEITWYENVELWEVLKIGNHEKIQTDLNLRLKKVSLTNIKRLQKTLSALINSNFNYSEAARLLSIHRNGLRDRLNRFSTMMGCNLFNIEEAVSLWIAFKSSKNKR